MEDWERKTEILECLEADDDEYNPSELMWMLGYADLSVEEAEI